MLPTQMNERIHYQVQVSQLFGKIVAPLNLHIQRRILLTGGWQEIEEIKAGLIKLKRLT